MAAPVDVDTLVARVENLKTQLKESRKAEQKLEKLHTVFNLLSTLLANMIKRSEPCHGGKVVVMTHHEEALIKHYLGDQ